MLIKVMRFQTKSRVVYVILIALVIPAGLFARSLKPRYFATGDALGDALWATMGFLLISLIWPAMSLWRRAVAAIACAFAVEFTQLYHAPWIDRIRRTHLGAMVLGFTFDAIDLVWYVAGVTFGVMLERFTLWRK